MEMPVPYSIWIRNKEPAPYSRFKPNKELDYRYIKLSTGVLQLKFLIPNLRLKCFQLIIWFLWFILIQFFNKKIPVPYSIWIRNKEPVPYSFFKPNKGLGYHYIQLSSNVLQYIFFYMYHYFIDI